jgi:hypothetical protein
MTESWIGLHDAEINLDSTNFKMWGGHRARIRRGGSVAGGSLAPRLLEFGLTKMTAAFQAAEENGFSGKCGKRPTAAACPQTIVNCDRSHGRIIGRYSLIGLNHSRYFALADRNCCVFFLALEQFRAIRAAGEQRGFRKNGNRPWAAACLRPALKIN